MESKYRRLKWLCAGLLVLVSAETIWLGFPVGYNVVFPVQESVAARGRRLALELGCFSCHGPAGRGGVANPGSRWEEVPSFHEGTPMMFVKSDQDLRDYILDGAPAAKRARKRYLAEMEAQAIRMPAYRDWLDDDEVESLILFIRATSGLAVPPEGPTSWGADAALANGCFSCHGAMGVGGLPNPGSLKGYVPGFGGPDFEELVHDDVELRQWIAEGAITRLADNPAAAVFLDRQRIQMPAYGEFLGEDDIDNLVVYVRWLATEVWKTQEIYE